MTTPDADRTRRRWTGLLVGGAVGLPLLAVGGIVAMAFATTMLFATPPTALTTGGCAPAAPAAGGSPAGDGSVAATLARVAAETQAPPVAVLALFEAAVVESGVRNLSYGHSSSLGVLQQRPDMGWGSPSQVQDPAYAARAFLIGPARAGGVGANAEPGAIARVAEYPNHTAGQIAQVVQKSAFPERYDQAQAEAQALVRRHVGASGATPAVECVAQQPGQQQATGGIGPWGGFSNGRIPQSALAPIGGGLYLRPDAARAWLALQRQAVADLGSPIGVTDGYRSYNSQVQLKAQKGGLAATPGRSNHGWGLALDLVVPGCFSGRQYGWLRANGARYGWTNPDWARPGGSGPLECWHFEFGGTS